jgi:hypothetical protein
MSFTVGPPAKRDVNEGFVVLVVVLVVPSVRRCCFP